MHGFTQYAEGNVVLTVVPGSHHCGLGDTEINVDWEIELEFTGEALDDKGFLVDALDFNIYFGELAQIPLSYSCEMLARKIAKDFILAAATDKERLIGISVKISPMKGRAVKYRSSK